jgi:predicted transcriptional regulator
MRRSILRPKVELDDDLAAIDEGIAAADAGDLVDHEDVVAWVRSWGRPDELPLQKSTI